MSKAITRDQVDHLVSRLIADEDLGLQSLEYLRLILEADAVLRDEVKGLTQQVTNLKHALASIEKDAKQMREAMP